ncbi:zinc ribbon domain-containing protein [Thermococcus sp. GR7]|uniref:zinc ribbon domain-containing protein n=1 Tax=unclassified Thermococcus TaxID=2627626 RepID=UPI00143199DE|nr:MULTISPECIES: zinc ribbon domain-containing protein [unclassified Thermococcus]NJE46338.1 zinc ribbon domain-containing protein [Thermococcus sp. GR7]NJE77743.1 zinc ribbon domain-containing protein [Thermococcus sp. GR4]NJF23783.1 zinc ribbon domain-containing protein [Thermococcus sp. GR5]
MENEYSRAEKILATLFVIFLLLASINFLRELERIPAEPDYSDYQAKYGLDELLDNQSRLLTLERELFKTYQATEDNLTEAERVYLFKREEYRLAIESGNVTEELRQEYLQAKENYERAYARYLAAKGAYEDVHQQLVELNARIGELSAKTWDEYNREYQIYRLKVLALKLLFALPIFIISFLLFRKRRNIYTTSLIAYSSLLLIYLILSAIWSTIQMIGLSLFGAGASAAALYYLRKEYFKPGRVYKRRIGQNRCYRCGFPVKDDYLYCPNCGAKLKEKCENCGAMRPLYLEFCPYCGVKVEKMGEEG